MNINDQQIDREVFDLETNNRFRGEPLESFKCKKCNLLFIGLPDCHLAFYDPREIKKTITYNRPETLKCPNCGYVFPSTFLAPENIKDHEITAEVLLKSDWGRLLK